MNSHLESSITELEVSLGLEKGYFFSIEKEDDWSFVIKMNALIEAACTHLISSYFHDERLDDLISRMQLGSRKSGKLSFVFKLGLLPNEFILFIEKLSELRNSIIHKIENVEFNFPEHLNNINNNQKNTFVSWVKMKCDEGVVVGDKSFDRKKFILDNPKLSVFLGVMEILAFLNERSETFVAKKKILDLKIEYANTHIDRNMD